MRAVRRVGTTVALVDADEPAGDGVTVHVRACGICGTDLTLLRFGRPSPYTLGHEIAGVLDDGTAVAVEPLISCGACRECETGRYNLCGALRVVGVSADGGLAPRVVVPERSLVRLADGVDVRDASLVEPLAVAVHGLRLAGVGRGTRVGVVGGGSIGLSAVATARAAGAAEVALVARHPHQARAGEAMGALVVPGGDYDVAIDAGGSPSSLATAVRLARPGGTVLVLASYFGAMEVDGKAAMFKELTVIVSLTYGAGPSGRDIDAAAALLATTPLIGRTIISHRFPLEDAGEAFAVAGDKSRGALKVVIEPDA